MLKNISSHLLSSCPVKIQETLLQGRDYLTKTHLQSPRIRALLTVITALGTLYARRVATSHKYAQVFCGAATLFALFSNVILNIESKLEQSLNKLKDQLGPLINDLKSTNETRPFVFTAEMGCVSGKDDRGNPFFQFAPTKRTEFGNPFNAPRLLITVDKSTGKIQYYIGDATQRLYPNLVKVKGDIAEDSIEDFRLFKGGKILHSMREIEDPNKITDLINAVMDYNGTPLDHLMDRIDNSDQYSIVDLEDPIKGIPPRGATEELDVLYSNFTDTLSILRKNSLEYLLARINFECLLAVSPEKKIPSIYKGTLVSQGKYVHPFVAIPVIFEAIAEQTDTYTRYIRQIRYLICLENSDNTSNVLIQSPDKKSLTSFNMTIDGRKLILGEPDLSSDESNPLQLTYPYKLEGESKPFNITGSFIRDLDEKILKKKPDNACPLMLVDHTNINTVAEFGLDLLFGGINIEGRDHTYERITKLRGLQAYRRAHEHDNPNRFCIIS